MGNELSLRRRWCRRFRRFEKLPAEEGTAVPGVPDVPTAQSGRFWGSVTHPESAKRQGAAAGLHSKEPGWKRETASCSPPVGQGMRRNPELQEPGDAGDNPPVTNPDGKTPALTLEKSEPAGGQSEVTTRDFPLQPAVGMGAGGDTERGTVTSSSGLHERPHSSSGFHRRSHSNVCRASPLCKWLKKLRTPAEKPKAKPGAVTSRE